MELPTWGEILQMAEDFGNETYPTLIAIIAIAFYLSLIHI